VTGPRKGVTMSPYGAHLVSQYLLRRNDILQMATQLECWIAVVGLLALIAWFLYVDNTFLQVTKYQIPLDALPKEFDGFRIALVSDLHGSIFGMNQSRLVSEISEFQPDMIAVAGDLFDERPFTRGPAESFVKNAKDIAPIFYVTGNHEVCSESLDLFISEMNDYGVIFLRNDAVDISRGSSRITLMGIDDPLIFDQHTNGQKEWCRQSLSDIASSIDEDVFTVLMSHRPDLIELYASSGVVDLVLSGHAHGGMIRVPGIGGLISAGQGFLPRYTEGIYRENNTTMVVSRGLGNSGRFQVRIFNRPEIVLITLTKQ